MEATCYSTKVIANSETARRVQVAVINSTLNE